MLKGKIFKFFLDVMHTDAFGKRGINLKRFCRNPHPFFRLRDVMQRAHVMQTVRKLHQKNTDVLGHRKQQLAEILRLL